MSEPVPKDPHVETAGTQGKSILANPEKPENPETGYTAKIIEYGPSYLIWELRAGGRELYVLRASERDSKGFYYISTERIHQFSDLQLAKEAAAKIKGVIEQ
jgi:hypothetical protein